MRHAVANATATSGRGSAISKVNSCKPFSNEEILTDCLCTGRACAYASPALAGLGSTACTKRLARTLLLLRWSLDLPQVGVFTALLLVKPSDAVLLLLQGSLMIRCLASAVQRLVPCQRCSRIARGGMETTNPGEVRV